MPEHTYLIAVTVEAHEQHSRAEVERALYPWLPQPHTRLHQVDAVVDSWWVAEDDRQDRSDNDSAIFVPYRGPVDDRAALDEGEREQLLEEWDGIGHELTERVEAIIRARYERNP